MVHRNLRGKELDLGTMTLHSTLLSRTVIPHSLLDSTCRYPIPNMTMQPPTKWVYEWEGPHFYTMIVHDWETTLAWTGQSWQDLQG
jgi:hypothetical protein